MDWIIWLVVIVAIVAVVWWLLNRNSSRSSSGSAGTGTAATHDSTPPRLHDVDRDATHRGALSGGGPAPSAPAAGPAGMPAAAGFNQAEPEVEPAPTATAAGASAKPAVEAAPAGAGPEWETQWSETPPAEPHAALHQKPGAGSHDDHTMAAAPGVAAATSAPVHHPEYTEPHAPTLPGAESAAAESEIDTEAAPDAKAETGPTAVPATAQAPAEASPAGAETRQTVMSSAASETAVGHTAEPTGQPTGQPAGHLAVDQPYGEGSAAPAPDGSGPDGFTVKGDASSMVYHDETSPAFEETRAEVWFLSAAHAEAAGFRAPRRTRQ